MAKPDCRTKRTRAVAQRVIAHALDALLRLLHPMIPFMTEEVWRTAGSRRAGPRLAATGSGVRAVVVAPWPAVELDRQDKPAGGAIRQIPGGTRRDTGNPQPAGNRPERERGISSALRRRKRRPATADGTLFRANGQRQLNRLGCGHRPAGNACQSRHERDGVFVDLKDFIDIEAEIERNAKQEEKLLGMIGGKEKKLSNDNFVKRAPADVVQREREGLENLKLQLDSVRQALEKLRSPS